jgi:hypothetical protein
VRKDLKDLAVQQVFKGRKDHKVIQDHKVLLVLEFKDHKAHVV